MRIRIVFVAVSVFVLIGANLACEFCSKSERAAYSLAYLFGVFLIWESFFNKTIFIGSLAVDSNSDFKYLIRLIGCFFITYTLYLLFVGN